MASSASTTDRKPDVTRPRWVSSIRARVVRFPAGLMVWRVLIGLVGLVILAGGIVMLPLPGPGWLVIFLGIGVWATEFGWAGRLLRHVQAFAKHWSARVQAAPRWVKALVAVAVLLIVAAVAFAGWWFYVR